MDLAARVCAKKGDVAKAISEYERLFTLDVRAPYLVHPLYHYRLGLLYERAGEAMKAKAQYQKFLDLWKDADPGRPEVEDAKKRLASLNMHSRISTRREHAKIESSLLTLNAAI
jgi:tetratricopeptide (TPR) repeat protein